MDVSQRVTVACSLILVLAAVVVGWQYWSARSEATRVRQELVAATQEIGRLDAIVEEVTARDAQRVELERRVTLAEDLLVIRAGRYDF